jgi:uncharacterized protein with PQ loop repeat
MKFSLVNSVCSGGLLSVFFFVPQLIKHNPKCPNLHAVHISMLACLIGTFSAHLVGQLFELESQI